MREQGGSRVAAAAAALICVCLGALTWLAPPAAAQGDVTLSVVPGEVSLIPGAAARGVVVLANGGAQSARVKLKAIPADSSVKVRFAEKKVAVPASSSVTVRFRARRIGEGTGQDVAVTLVAVHTRPGDPGTTHSSTATLTVKAAASSALVEATITSSFKDINENRPRVAALVLENVRETPVTVEALRVTAPADVTVDVECPEGGDLVAEGGATESFDGCSFEIPPRSQIALRVGFTADDSLAPGPRDAIFVVSASTTGPDVTTGAVATLSFTAEIFAESDLLKALGAPIFLLLPGVIIAVTAWFLIVRVSPWKRAAATAEVKPVPTMLTTGVVGVAVSLVVAGLYPWLTKNLVPNEERDYLSGYGFDDFYYVFGYSFALAIVVWALSLVAYWLNLARRWLFVPMPFDDENDVVRKVGLRGMLSRRTAFPLMPVESKHGLKIAERAAGKCIVSPSVRIVFTDPKLRPDVVRHVKGERIGDPLRLWRTVRKALRADATISFKTDGFVPGVALVASAPEKAQSIPIVEVGLSEEKGTGDRQETEVPASHPLTNK